MTLAAGSSFGPYQILGALGRGGMATVYKAYEPSLDRYVALKVLPREFIHDPGFATRFEREAKVIAKLEHPNIIPIHNFGIDAASSTPWMAMRFISGGTLSAVVKGGRLAPARAILILRGVADALDYAHGKGVIHRDVKPQNILLDDAERVYLADFGIAKMVENSPGLTVTGMVTGTPQYMAPEQGMGKKIDNRVDIYALGIVAYEMLTGQVPFSADTPVAVLMKHVTGPIPVPAPEDVPEVYTRALLKALAKNPEERWPSAGAFLAALEMGLGEAPTAAGLPAVEMPTVVSAPQGAGATAATAVSPGPGVAPTIVSPAESATTAPGVAPPEPTLIVSGAPARATQGTPAPLPASSRPATPGPAISGLGLILGALSLILVLGVIGAAVLLWPRASQDDLGPEPLVGQSAPLPSEIPTLPPPMTSQPGATPVAAAPRDSATGAVVSTLPPATVSPSSTPSAVTPADAPTPSEAPPQPYRDAGKVVKGDDFFEKTLTFVRNGSVPFDAQVGPLRIPSVKFVAREGDDRNVSLQMLFPVDCPKDAGEWNFVIRVYWLDERGKTMEDDTDHDGCNGQGKTSILQERNVASAEAAAIRGVRVRFEATPD